MLCRASVAKLEDKKRKQAQPYDSGLVDVLRSSTEVIRGQSTGLAEEGEGLSGSRRKIARRFLICYSRYTEPVHLCNTAGEMFDMTINSESLPISIRQAFAVVVQPSRYPGRQWRIRFDPLQFTVTAASPHLMQLPLL